MMMMMINVLLKWAGKKTIWERTTALT